MEPLPAATIADLTPTDVTVKFYDGQLEAIPFNAPTDLVAISVETYTAKRAFQIAIEASRGCHFKGEFCAIQSPLSRARLVAPPLNLSTRFKGLGPTGWMSAYSILSLPPCEGCEIIGASIYTRRKSK